MTRWLGADAWQRLVLESTGTGRNVLFRKASERTAKQTRGNYPAPHAILDVVRTGLEEGRDAGLAAERAAFARLSQTPASRALVRLFLGTKRLERQADELAAVHGPPRVARVSVIGAGLMGGGIAAVTAKAGIMVRLKDVDDHALAAGLSAVDAVLAERVRRRSTSAEDARRARLLVTATRAERGLAAADLVIEAVPEDLALKRSILAGLAAAARPDVVLASNTSSIPIARIAEALPDPSRLLGMHYFSPVAKMPLLEIVRTDATADDALAAALAVGRAQGKTPVVVRDGPGFYTTRILAAYLVEAVALLAEGVRPRAVDAALVDFGFPVGPLVVADEVGIDVAAKIAGVLREAFGERMEPPPLLGALLADGRVGRKGGSGFYRYDEGRRTDDERLFARLGITAAASEPDGEAIAKRCALRLVDEAVRCLEDGVLASPEDGDLAAVLGLGFPPFRGGPFRHVDAEGAERVVDDLRALRDRHGARFEPCGLLVAMASDPHRRFHDDERAAPA